MESGERVYAVGEKHDAAADYDVNLAGDQPDVGCSE